MTAWASADVPVLTGQLDLQLDEGTAKRKSPRHAVGWSKDAVEIFLSLEDCLSVCRQTTSCSPSYILENASNRRVLSEGLCDYNCGGRHISSPSEFLARSDTSKLVERHVIVHPLCVDRISRVVVEFWINATGSGE